MPKRKNYSRKSSKRNYKKSGKKRKKFSKRKSGKSVIRLVRSIVPQSAFMKFVSSACFTLPVAAGLTSVSIDVQLNSLYTPWNQTVNYTTACTATMGTLAPSAQGFEGLSNWLTDSALGNVRMYRNYRVIGGRITITATPNSVDDNGMIGVIPWKSGDSQNGSMDTLMIAPYSKTAKFNLSKPGTVSLFVNPAKLYGVPKIAMQLSPDWSATSGNVPTRGVYARIIAAAGDGAVISSNINFQAKLTCYAVLFNQEISRIPEDVVA